MLRSIRPSVELPPLSRIARKSDARAMDRVDLERVRFSNGDPARTLRLDRPETITVNEPDKVEEYANNQFVEMTFFRMKKKWQDTNVNYVSGVYSS